MNRPRVALLTPIPGPYRLPFFEELSRLCNLHVFFDSLSEPNRNWVWQDSDFRFPYSLLKGFHVPFLRGESYAVPSERRFLQIRLNILPQLFKFKPEIVVSAEMGPRTLQASLYCRLAGIPLVIWWEGTPHTDGIKKGIKPMIRRHLAGQAARFWSNGKESAQLH